MVQFNSGADTALDREKNRNGGAWRLMIFMSVVFSVFLLSYLGLVVGYKPFVKAQITKKEQALEDLAAQVPKDQQEDFLKFEYQLSELQNVLARHNSTAKLFVVLETSVNQGVFYRNLDLDVTAAKAALKGTAQSYDVLAQQLASYQRVSDIVNFQVSNLRLGQSGRVDFDVNLFLKPELFKIK